MVGISQPVTEVLKKVVQGKELNANGLGVRQIGASSVYVLLGLWEWCFPP